MKNTIPEANITVITTHINADFDGMASMIAAKKLHPEGVLVFSGSQEKLIRDFFVQTTSYLFDFKKLKEIDLSRVKKLVLVDTRQASRIGKFIELLKIPELEVHIYDHHPPSEDDIIVEKDSKFFPRGDFNFSVGNVVIKDFGSTTAILAQILSRLSSKETVEILTPEEATIMMLGIFEDTGSFTFSSTKPEDFEAAAFLLRTGADLNLVADVITKDLTAEQISILNELINSARIYNIHGVDVCVTSLLLNHYIGDFALIVHKFRDIQNLNVVFALAGMEDKVYMVARSRIPEVNVGEIASYFGGGGHNFAASATIKDKTLIEVENRLWELLKSYIRPSPTARDLMTSPPICVDAETAVKEAEEIMVRYNINAIPVLQNGKIEGIISRQTLEKLIYHGLGDVPVQVYMNRDFKTVSPNQGIIDIQAPLIEEHQRILPVVEDGKVIGIITRRDLLKYLVEERSTEPKDLQGVPLGIKRRQKNILNQMKERLPSYIVELLRRLGETGQKLNYGTYAVGGFVRDILLKRDNLDIDIVVEGDGIAFAEAFAKEYGLRFRSHRKFNTAVLIFPDGLKVDVASARMEYYKYPAALPIVEFSSLKMDLYRRDFTINTLAIDLIPSKFGQLIDFFGGQRDIKEKVIRVLHSLSFVEDPTRILRAIRFEKRFDFQIAKQTERLMKDAIKMGLLERLGGYRLFHEFQHILMEENPVSALRRMAEFNILPVFSPKIVWDEKKELIFKRLKEVISWYELSFFDDSFERWWIYFIGFFSDLREENLLEIADKLALPQGRREKFVNTYRKTFEVLKSLRTYHDPPTSVVYRHFSNLEVEELLFMMAYTESSHLRRLISQYLARHRYEKVELRGKDLKAMGIPPGPIYSKLLKELLYARLDGLIKSKEDEINYIKRHYPEIFVPERNN